MKRKQITEERREIMADHMAIANNCIVDHFYNYWGHLNNLKKRLLCEIVWQEGARLKLCYLICIINKQLESKYNIDDIKQAVQEMFDDDIRHTRIVSKRVKEITGITYGFSYFSGGYDNETLDCHFIVDKRVHDFINKRRREYYWEAQEDQFKKAIPIN